MNPDLYILTNMQDKFLNVFTNGIGLIQNNVMWLLVTLATIDLILIFLFNLEDIDAVKTLIKKTMKYGFFIWLVTNWQYLLGNLLAGFAWFGLKAGGNRIGVEVITDPSAIVGTGMEVAMGIFNPLTDIANFVFGMQHIIIIKSLVAFLILVCFGIMGIQFFITYLEFYFNGVLALVLIPFGANKHTAFIGEKALGAVISHGVKFMALTFIASTAIPIVKAWNIYDPNLEACFYTLIASAALCFLAWHAPKMAMGLISGSPSLEAGDIARTTAGAIRSTGALVSGTGTAIQGGKALAGAVTKTAGALTQSARLGSMLTGAATPNQQAINATRGVGQYALGRASQAIKGAVREIKSPFQAGGQAAQRMSVEQMMNRTKK